MAKTNTIITIGRQYGSAGREIGYKVAKDLGIKLYDKEMLDRAAKESGLCQEFFETHDEKPTSSFLYSLVMERGRLIEEVGELKRELSDVKKENRRLREFRGVILKAYEEVMEDV